jgi:hypothetical protein
MNGTPKGRALTELLQSLREARRTGVLHVARGDATKRVYLEDGAIVFAGSDLEMERIGELLVREGTLKRRDLELACQVREASQLRLGRTLVEMGYLTNEELERRVKQQIVSIILSAFPWKPGDFLAELKDEALDPDLARRDLSTENILLAGVRMTSDPEVARRGIVHLDGALNFACEPTDIGDQIHLTPEEGFVLSRVDGHVSSSEIAQVSPLGEDETLRCIYGLIVAGILSVEAPPKSVATPAVESPSPVEETPPVEPSESPKATAFRVEMMDKYARSAKCTHYELLDVEPTASGEQIKTAYFALAKRLHPDHRAGLGVADPDGVFDELYLRVKAAYEVLTKETERRRYDFQLEQRKPKTVKRPNPAPVKPAKTTPERTFSAEQMARIHFGNGQGFLSDGRFHEAVEQLREAVRLDGSRSEYHRALGQALAKNPKWRRQAEEHFLEAIHLNRFDATAYLELGTLYEEGGMSTRARKMYESALGVDPDNPVAIERLHAGSERGALEKLKGVLGRDKGN